jgi:NAD+ diphosphatase
MPNFESLVALPPSTDPMGPWHVVGTGASVLVDRHGRPPFAKASPVETPELPIFMGLLDGVATWAVGADESTDLPDGFDWQPLRSLGMQLDTSSWMWAGRAVQLVEWVRTSRFCGRCGTATEISRQESAARCPSCGLSAYPRLAPAIIVVVERDTTILLGQGRGFGGTYSALAGFAEPGETLEEAVRREVREEVGVEVGLVRYFGSQPWPFPHSLMIGFFATWLSGEIQVDGEEIVDARWFVADTLPPIPPTLSIARQLIDDWVRRHPGAKE